MSRIFYEDIDFKELTQNANSIFVVKKSEPYITKNTIKIENNNKYSDYTQITLHYEIIEILKGNNDLKPKQKIMAYPANKDENFNMYKEYVVDQLSVSPIFMKYRNFDENFNIENKAEFIIFLNNYDEKHFILCVVNAYEDIKYKKEVLELIKSNNN